MARLRLLVISILLPGLGIFLPLLLLSLLLLQPTDSVAQSERTIQDGKNAQPERTHEITTDLGKNTSSSGANCVDGFAGIYPCLGLSMQAHLSVEELGGVGVQVNDLWGWHDKEFGRYYILIGRSDATAFVDVTDASPRYLGELLKTEGSITSTWRDIKVLDHYALIVADGAGRHGMQVFDLHDLRVTESNPIQFSSAAVYTSIASSHNIVVNEETRFAYAVGSRMGGIHCNGGLHMIDMADPLNPSFAGCYSDVRTRRGYSHDAQCVVYHGPDLDHTGKEICLGSNESALSIVDVSDKKAPISLGVGEYPDARYVHQGWLTDDHVYFFQDDEADERFVNGPTRTLIWDVSDLDDPVVIAQFVSTIRSVDHNQYVVGNKVYQANYTSGLRVLDISDVVNPKLVQFFDTRPQDEDLSFNGAWSVFPFFDNGMIYVSSRDEGLFILASSDIPVTEISSSDIRLDGSDVTFSWSTESEFRVSQFEVQERLRDHSYTVLATVQGAGTTFVPQTYEWTHSAVEPGRHEYRLQIVAEDGSRQAGPSETIILIPGTHLLTEIFPNPAFSQARIELLVKDAQHVRAVVYTIEGREVGVWIDDLISENASLELEFDVSRLASGSYFLKVEGQNFSETRRFVVAR